MRLRIRKFGSQKGVFRLPFRHHSHQEKRLNMRNEERESDEEVNSFVIMVKDDLVDQEGEGGGLLAYPENVWFAV